MSTQRVGYSKPHRNGKSYPFLSMLVGVGDRPVEEDRVPLGERAVVHDRAAVDRDVDRAADLPAVSITW